MSKAFSPATPLERAVHAGKYEDVLELLRSSTPQERKGLRNSAVALMKLIDKARWSYSDKTYAGWGKQPTDKQMRAASAAVVVCGTPKDAAEHYDDIDDLKALLTEFRPASLEGLADEMLAVSPMRIRDVQELIVAGLVPRPTSNEYAIGLIALPTVVREVRGENIYDMIAADKGLRDVLLRIMEVEGTTDCSLSALDKFSHGGAKRASWSQVLRTLCDQGVLTRSALLDRTLAALENDWPQFRSSWFSRFHEELEPSVAEMAPNTHRYLALCGSRIPPTVTMAIGVLKKLDAASPLDPAKLLEALRPVLSSSVKAQVDAGLKMLDQIVERKPSRAADAASLVAPALAHASADIQKQVLRRISQWGVDDAIRRTLREYVPMVAAVNRKALEQLVAGGAGTGAREGKASKQGAPSAAKEVAAVKGVGAAKAVITAKAAAPAKAPPAGGRVPPLDPGRRLAPVESLDELVERIAYVFENPTDIDEFERVVGALVQSAPLTDESRSRFGPLLKRVPKMSGKPMARELARLVVFLLAGERVRSRSTVDTPAILRARRDF